MTNALARAAKGLVENQSMSLTQATKESARFLALDISGSMLSYTDDRQTTKIAALRRLVYSVRGEGIPFKQIVFSNHAELREDIPDPDGGTNLHAALALAREHKATRIVVMSDGAPDTTENCLDFARTAGIPIDTFYIGPREAPGEEFLRQLSSLSGGTAHTGDLGAGVKALESDVKSALLALPPAIAL